MTRRARAVPLLALALVILAGCAERSTGGSQPPTLTHRFTDRRTGTAIRYPAGWHVIRRPITGVVYPPQRLALTSFRLEDRRPDRGCTPRTAIHQMPPTGAFVYMYEDTHFRGSRRVRDQFAHLPAQFALRRHDYGNYECFGKSYGLLLRDRGRYFHLHVYLGKRVSRTTRQTLLRILDSLRISPR